MTGKRVAVLVVLFAIAFGLRAGAALHVVHSDPDRRLNNDTPSYVEPARSLAEHGVYDQAGKPAFIRTPGYPVFVAAVFEVFGTASDTPLLLAQAALGALTVVLTVLIGWRLASWRAGVLAGAVCCIDPQQIALSGIILTETLFTLLLTAMVLALVTSRRSSHRGVAIGAGVAALVLLAAATYVRPVTIYFPVCLLVVALGAAAIRRMRRWLVLTRGMVLALLVGVVAFYLAMLPWGWRNGDQVGSARFSGIEAIDLYYYRAAEVESRTTGRDLLAVREDFARTAVGHDLSRKDAQEIAFGAIPPEYHDRQGAYLDDLDRRATAIIRAHPLAALITAAAGVPRILVAPGEAETFDYLLLGRSPSILALGYAAFVVLVLGLAAVGIIFLLRRGPTWLRSVLLSWLTLVVYLVVISAGPQAEARFRAPIMPVLYCCAAAGLFALVAWVRHRRSPSGVRQTVVAA